MIAHLDADSFFASVLLRKHPEHRGKPLLAVGMGPSIWVNGRASGGCVIAATYEAKAYGVKTGMRLSEARKLVPGAIEMPSDFRETGIASAEIESILRDLCPLVEQMSIDEWFLDLSSLVGGDPKDPETWALGVQQTVLRTTDLSVSLGVADSKLLAKMAGEYRKPAGVTFLRQTDIQSFLNDRPVGAIPGVGRQRQAKVAEAGIVTAWDFTQTSDEALIRLCGKQGVEMKRELLGERLFPVQEDPRPPQSISRCRAFRVTSDPDFVKAHLCKHLEYCTMKMRRHGLACADVSVWLRTGEYSVLSIHRRLSDSADTVTHILPAVLSVLSELLQEARRYTQIGLALHGLRPAGTVQPSLFENASVRDADEHLQTAIDALHAKFGRDSVTRAAALPVRSGTKQELDFSIV